VGHKEQLLAAAKRLVVEQGYGNITARDLVAVSGTNLASIGYHFGSKDALLSQAVLEAMIEWSEVLDQVAPPDPTADPIDRLEAIWGAVITSVSEHRALWVASFEAYVQAERQPELRAAFAESYRMARRGLASLIERVAEDAVGPEMARTIGGLLLATMPGVAAQWLIDPDDAPSAAGLIKGVRRLMELSR